MRRLGLSGSAGRIKGLLPNMGAAMAISDLSPTAATKGPPCTVCRALKRLPSKDSKALRAHLSNPEWRFTELSDALFEEGLDIKAHSLARHARGDCTARERLR